MTPSAPSGPPSTSPGPDRRHQFTFMEQVRLLRPILGFWTVGCALLVALTLHDASGEYLLDPTDIGGQAWYTGLVLKLTIVGWALGCGIAGAASWFARIGRRARAARFLASAAIVGGVTLIDSVFGVRQRALPVLGVPRFLGVVLFALPFIALVAANLPEVRRTRTHLLQAALIAVGVGFMVNALVGDVDFGPAKMYEAGSRFLGVIAWLVYLTATARDIARSILGSATSKSDAAHQHAASVPESTSANVPVHA